MIALSFIAFLVLFLGVGLASAFRAGTDRNDYYLAGRSVSPWLAALSAVATQNSGYMFIGVIGYTYAAGFAAVWLMVGWLVGDFIASLYIHRRLHAATVETNEASFASVLSLWSGREFAVWRRLAALVMIAFLGSYAAAQIAAGGKALQGVLGWDPQMGAVIVSVMILAYSIAGGIRASIWTDAVQSVVMFAAMTTLFVVALAGQGGVSGAVAQFREIPGYFDVIPPDMFFPGLSGVILFVIGWVFAGASVIGQPHIMVRFMALKDADRMIQVRLWYYGYFVIFYCLATGVGLLARLHLPDLASLDPELALPTMARELLPGALVGMILAGIFAATMSTADSLVLSCSAALTHDFAPERLEKPWMLKTATALVTGLALAIALIGPTSVFDLVILSWSTLGAAFGPLMIAYAIGRKPGEIRAILALLIGAGVTVGWREAGLADAMFEGAPGVIAGLAVLLSPALPRARSQSATTSGG